MTDLRDDPVTVEIAAAERSLDYLRNQQAAHQRTLEKISQQIDANERHLARLRRLAG